MSKFCQSDTLKTRKQETKISNKDVPRNRTILVKKQSASGTTKTLSQIKETSKPKEEKDKLKTKLKPDASKNTIEKLQTENKLVLRNTTTSIAQQKKNPPLRAKHSSIFTESVKSNRSSKASTLQLSKKRNSVLDTPHNVTVSSPPPKRNNRDNVKSPIEVATEVPQNSNTKSQLNRKNSRTLAPEEIVILKKDIINMKISKPEPPTMTDIKNPIAFEVKFEEKGKATREKSILVAKSNNMDNITVIEKNDEEYNYSDDFESYESDFETGSSIQSLTTTDKSSTENEENSKKEPQSQSTIDNSEDESELTQNPITVIHRNNERKLDSGHYDINSQRNTTHKFSDFSNSIQQLTDCVEAFSCGISDQLDSGISGYDISSLPISYNNGNMEIIYGGYKDFTNKPIINRRGLDLMFKIHFDVIGFTLFELKPISYDVFMQTFGKLNTNQSYTQTQDNIIDMEQQTDFYETRTIWTQHPAKYNLKITQDFDHNQTCCGESIYEYNTDTLMECKLEQSLQKMKILNSHSLKRSIQNYQKRQRKVSDYEHFNSFLLRSSLVLNQILTSSNNNVTRFSIQNTENEKSNQILSQISEKFYYLEANFLNTLKVLRIFSNNKHNILITVHESLPDTDIYSSDFSNLLMVWSINASEKPLRLLTTWSQVSKIEISNDSSDIIVAALRDGSLSLWDLRETYSYCSKLDGYLTYFGATQSVLPSWYGMKTKFGLVMDLGCCLDVKSFKSPFNTIQVQTALPKTQFVSLHDSGVITIWTLVESSDSTFNLVQAENREKSKYSSESSQTFEYISPWARIKLIQSTILSVKDYLETKSQQTQSRFDKTKTFFQKDIYSDEALKELNQSNPKVGQQGLRFTSLECGSDNLFICTNRNYILMCSKTLKVDRLKRIMINENRFLFPTVLKLLNNEQFLAVGLSNGAIMILNCQSKNIKQNRETIKTPVTHKFISPKKDSIFDIDTTTLMGKACAIQNIVLNSHKSYDNMDLSQQYGPNTAAIISLIECNRQPFELRVFDQQIIMNGAVLRKNLIQNLELSSDGWRLFALTNGHIRMYDFYLDKEIAYQEIQESGSVLDIAIGRCGNNTMSLMILKPNSQIEIHILKK